MRYLLTLLSLLFISTLFAQPSDERRDELQDKLQQIEFEAIKKELKLDAKRSAELKVVYEAYKEKNRAFAPKRDRGMRERLEQMSEEQIEREIIASLESNVESAKLKLEYYNKMREILTPSEMAKLYAVERQIRESIMLEERKRREGEKPKENE
ncbi:MAG: Spy/CpxP family protein refolding chaperone [Rikenellaceae bacterium]